MTLAGIGASLIVTAFVLSAGLCALARRVAPLVGLVDRPGGRKAHQRVTPLGGGVAIWLTVVIVLAIGAMVAPEAGRFLPEEPAGKHLDGLLSRQGELIGIMALATAIMVMGLIDDARALGPWVRLVIQIVLASVFVYNWGRVTLFLPDYPIVRGLTGVLTVIWIVGLTNAFNFLDNMDGLAASVGLIAALLFATAQVAAEGLFVPAVLLVLVGTLGGFLVHNAPPARLFMGDAGSNFLGFLLGALTVVGTFTRSGKTSPYNVLAPLLVMAVPLYDTCSVVLIRLREGRSPFQADRRHFSHRLVDRGLPPSRAVATIDLVTVSCGLGALLLHGANAPTAVIIVGQTICLLGVVAILEASGSSLTATNGRRGGAQNPIREPKNDEASTTNEPLVEG